MAKSNVAPTKSNLLAVKAQLAISQDGYELLEQKREILVMELMRMVDKVKLLEQKIDETIAKAYPSLKNMLMSVGSDRVERIAQGVSDDFNIKEKPITAAGMQFNSIGVELPERQLFYSFMDSFADTDKVMAEFFELLELLTEMASIRTIVWRLAMEVKKTQRRVNALDKMVIPQARETKNYIESVLEERERENVFVLSMLFGLLVIFPLLENFRYWSGEFTIGLSFDFLNEMHFDASQNFMIVMKNDVVTWGRQLLGALLFWLPRSIWETKPIGSGAFVAEEFNCDFTNISMPWFAEGYINFGFFGILLFTVLLSWFCSFYDSKYWNNRNSQFTPYYLLLVSSLLFFLRGDLMSSLAYTLATLFDIYIVYKVTSSDSLCTEE